MRPIALLGLLLLLPACGMLDNTVGNPFSGFGGFFGDTVSFRANPNRPVPDSENTRRVMGQEVESEPVLPEPGNIWPAMPRPEPTLGDISRTPPSGPAANPAAPAAPPRPMPRTSTVTPAPAPAAPLPAAPVQAPVVPAPQIAPPAPVASGTVLQTGSGPAVITSGNNGIMTFTLPNGTSGRAINNGNGTMTLIGTDGTVMSVPAPR